MYLNNAFAGYATLRCSFSHFCKHWVQIKTASTVALTNHNVKSEALDTNMASKTLQDDMLVPKDGGFQVRKYLYQHLICAIWTDTTVGLPNYDLILIRLGMASDAGKLFM